MTYSHLEMTMSKKVSDDLTYAIPEIQKLRIEAIIAKSNEAVTQSEKLIEEV